MSGSIQRIEPIRRILQGGSVFREGFGGALQFEEHVCEHFTRGHGKGVDPVRIFAIRGSAQRLHSFVGFALGEGYPGFRFQLLHALVLSFVSVMA